MARTSDKTLRRAGIAKGNYTEYGKVAFRTAFDIVRQKEDAEDIAQVTSMRFILNEQKIAPEAAKNWVIATARNESYLMMDKVGRKKEVQYNPYDAYEQKITDFLNEKYSNNIDKSQAQTLMEEIKANCNPTDKMLLEKYLIDGRKLCEYNPTRGLKLKRKSLYQKLYRLRKDVRAERYKFEGRIASKDLLSFRLNDSIIRFIRKYKKCLDERSFESMQRYFNEIGVPSEAPRLNIKKIIDYDVHLLDPKEYQIFVYYIDNRKSINHFSSVLKLSDSGNLVIKEMPNDDSMVQRHVVYEKGVPKELLEKLDDHDEEGYLRESGISILNELRSLPDAVIQTKQLKVKKKIRLDS